MCHRRKVCGRANALSLMNAWRSTTICSAAILRFVTGAAIRFLTKKNFVTLVLTIKSTHETPTETKTAVHWRFNYRLWTLASGGRRPVQWHWQWLRAIRRWAVGRVLSRVL